MPRLLFFYLSKRIALATLLVATGLCVPVVMTTLFQYLPPAAIRGGLLMPALLGILPTVVYIALPMAVGVAVALEFARMSADGMIAVLYSMRLSAWAISFPVKYGRRALSGSGNRQQTSHWRQARLGTSCGSAIGGVTKAPTSSSVYADMEGFQSVCGPY